MNILKIRFSALLLFFFCSTFLVPVTNAIASSTDGLQVFLDKNGIRIVDDGEIELYFNVTNGGEITEYFDLLVDPSRLNNLANIGWKPYYNLLPLFTSLFYNPYSDQILSTGGDPNARIELIANTSEYVILQTASRVMSLSGQVAKDTYDNVIYVISTWIVRDSGLVSVERALFVPRYATVPSGWRWYPFYLTRRAGFNYNGTFYMFNTTYTSASVVNEATYRNRFDFFSLLPNDSSRVFGVALPFSNVNIGGDGTHNILIAYKYDELVNVSEWRTDNYHSETNDVTESGAVHELSKDANFSTHTYHTLLNFTHQPISEEYVQSFAGYYADHTSIALLMNCSIATNKDVYEIGDAYAFYASGVSYYNLTGLTARLTVKNSTNRIVYQRDYGPGDTVAGRTFNMTLLTGNIRPDVAPDEYKLWLQIFSPGGIMIAYNSKVITIVTP